MDSDYTKKVDELKSKIKSFPDFPKEGILFWDIFSALSDGHTCKLLQSLLVETIRNKYPDVEAVVGLESRGFLFSFSVAAELGIACLPIRKKGKLPGEVLSYKYDLEYGSDILEIQKDSIRPGLKCLIIDDLIATGGSIAAAAKLLRTCKANVIGTLVIIELTGLNGRRNIPEAIHVHSLITYD
ncbi:adenine phosphoribosyltransferase [Pararge aegeria]|uniref:Adenine phosphoribosyltransferase n=2 Tax=Pararge aegeria TaxID=116150 RepID=A0A8S4RY26_9NEOP|nr:adenine phosphoribosyltransferase [Pararge aegeria]CAH2242231.1 jg25164 [Pararge aegeria aegeria]